MSDSHNACAINCIHHRERTRDSRIAAMKAMHLVQLLTSAALVAACSGAPDDGQAANGTPQDSTAMVLSSRDIATATMTTISSSIAISGPLQPKEVVTLRAQVDGTISALTVDRGSRVRRGQRLATLNAAGVISRAAGARAAVAAAKANLAVAQQQLEASTRLYAAGAVSALDKRSAEAAFEAAQSQLAAAESQLAGADEQAGFTALVSPIDGVVSSRPRQRGENVRVGDEVLTVVNGDVLELAGQIGVGDASRVRVGTAVDFTLDAFAGEAFRGRVARIDPVADPGTRQVGVYVELPNRNGRIVGGQFARGRIVLGETRALGVPTTAVRGAVDDSTGGTHVFVVRDGRVVRQAVTTGDRDDAAGVTAIVAGLREGEPVITTPSATLTDGLRVQLGPAADRAPQAPTVPVDTTPAAAAKE